MATVLCYVEAGADGWVTLTLIPVVTRLPASRCTSGPRLQPVYRGVQSMLSMTQDASYVQSRGKTKDPNRGGEFWKYYITVFVTIKCSKTHVQPFVLFVICYCYYLVVTGHCCESVTHRQGFYPGMFWGKSPQKTWNFFTPKNFCHIGNYNLNIEAKSNANYSTGFVICYLRS